MAKKKKDKFLVNERITCPHCKKGVIVKVKEEIIEPAIKAVKDCEVIVEKDSQTKLK